MYIWWSLQLGKDTLGKTHSHMARTAIQTLLETSASPGQCLFTAPI